VIVHLVDIGENVKYSCLNFIFIKVVYKQNNMLPFFEILLH